ncbi:hypothetical protein [Burkholderia pyrrocinia]|uniref:hypothetical protein n=1 Tax=Burkholderia pyrrocinia TaxID=60550 RepID=UPI001FC7EA14|nr:hypothetical protein [Burkholderia pyrrocinia]
MVTAPSIPTITCRKPYREPLLITSNTVGPGVATLTDRIRANASKAESHMAWASFEGTGANGSHRRHRPHGLQSAHPICYDECEPAHDRTFVPMPARRLSMTTDF